MTKLTLIKTIHTLIWAFMVAVIFYVVYCGVFDTVNMFTWIAVGIIILEGLVLLLFKMSCPLTVLARKYSDSTNHNFDIYLPEWLAKYNKQIFTSIYFIGLIIVLLRVF
jgi:hypothetical protein